MKRKVKKAKSKERNSNEYYRAIIRSLKKEVNSLKREISRFKRQEHNFHKEDYEDPEEILEVQLETCTDCGKGIYNELSIANRIIKTCNNCGHRPKAIKIK